MKKIISCVAVLWMLIVYASGFEEYQNFEGRERGEQPERGAYNESGLSEKEVLEFLMQKLPEQYEELENLRQYNPQAYKWQLAGARERIAFYFNLKKENPKLAESFLYVYRSEEESRRLAAKINRTKDIEQRKVLETKLRSVLNEIFDVRLKERERERDRLKKQIEEISAIIEQRKNAKNDIVEKHLEELISSANETLGWW